MAIVKSLILSLGVYCVPKISICSWFVAVENISGWWLDAFLIAFPPVGRYYSGGVRHKARCQEALGWRAGKRRGGKSMYWISAQTAPPPAAPDSANIHETVYTSRRAERWEMKEAKQKAMKGGRRKWKLYNRTANHKQKEKESSTHAAAAAAATRCSDLFQLDSPRVSVRVLVSSADICQPATSNYCPVLEKQTHSWNARMNLWQ